jgi:hypothetical protein
MNNNVMRVAWYRFRSTFRQSLTSYLTVVLLIGLVGGVGMASIAAARRTQSSYPTFVASTNPSDLTISVYDEADGGSPGTNLTREFSRLPDVRHVATLFTPPLVPLSANGAPRLNTLGFVVTLGSTDGMLVNQDKLAILKGHAANPRRIDQIVLSAAAARIYGVHVGQSLIMGLYTPSQQSLAGFGTAKVKPAALFHTTVVGIAALNTQIVQDGIDRAYGFVFPTPAMVKKIISVVPGIGPETYGIQLDRGGSDVAEVEQNLVNVVPRGLTTEFHVMSQVVSTTQLAIKPESVALGAFGVIAALACLVLVAQAISRMFQRSNEDRRSMRSIGASPTLNVVDGLLGVLGAVVLGSLIAMVVAIGLSPLAPLGPVRSVYPDRGVSFDWSVLGFGSLALVFLLGAAAVMMSFRAAPHRMDRRRFSEPRRSSFVRTLQAAGMSVPGVVGAHFALEPGRGRTAVPVRSVLVGTVFAVAMVVATLSFASGLSTLVSHPALYGWNWNYALNPTNTVPPQAMKLLRQDPDVAAFTGYGYTDAEVDGLTVPLLLTSTHDKIFPPMLSGHEIDANNQVVLGAATMAELHKRVGDTVTISYGKPDDAPIYVPPTKLVIVGTATLPALGYDTFVAQHTSMGTGVIAPIAAQPPAMLKALSSPDPNLDGPAEVFVRLRPGVSTSVGHADMERIARAANKVYQGDPKAAGNSVGVLSVEQPAQIVNYRSVGSTPIVLALGLALGAIVALGLTLTSSVRRRRRDLALLKTFGFTQRQLSATVAWQATLDAVVGVVLGIPIGILVGRELWTLFARNINAVPDPTVPVLSVILVGVGTLIFTNLVAVLPGRSAARTSTALVLRAE